MNKRIYQVLLTGLISFSAIRLYIFAKFSYLYTFKNGSRIRTLYLVQSYSMVVVVVVFGKGLMVICAVFLATVEDVGC